MFTTAAYEEDGANLELEVFVVDLHIDACLEHQQLDVTVNLALKKMQEQKTQQKTKAKTISTDDN